MSASPHAQWLAKEGYVPWVIEPDVLAALIARIQAASRVERARWWCALNCWRWPFEMPTPGPKCVLPRAQFDAVFDALGRQGGFAEARTLWRARTDAGQPVGGTGVDLLPEVVYPR